MVLVLGVVGFPDEESMVSALVTELTNATLAGVFFTRLPASSMEDPDIEYKLRFPYKLRTSASLNNENPFSATTSWQTGLTYPVFQDLGPRTSINATGGPPGS